MRIVTLIVMSAPLANNRDTTSLAPRKVAKCKAVLPPPNVIFKSSPCHSKSVCTRQQNTIYTLSVASIISLAISSRPCVNVSCQTQTLGSRHGPLELQSGDPSCFPSRHPGIYKLPIPCSNRNASRTELLSARLSMICRQPAVSGQCPPVQFQWTRKTALGVQHVKS